MADISKISVNGTEYNIKDSRVDSLRNKVNLLEEAAEGNLYTVVDDVYRSLVDSDTYIADYCSTLFVKKIITESPEVIYAVALCGEYGSNIVDIGYSIIPESVRNLLEQFSGQRVTIDFENQVITAGTNTVDFSADMPIELQNLEHIDSSSYEFAVLDNSYTPTFGDEDIWGDFYDAADSTAELTIVGYVKI